MPFIHYQTTYRANESQFAFVEIAETDEIGRRVGGLESITVKLTTQERAALDAIALRAANAQEAVIDAAKSDAASGKTPSTLKADLSK